MVIGNAQRTEIGRLVVSGRDRTDTPTLAASDGTAHCITVFVCAPRKLGITLMRRSFTNF